MKACAVAPLELEEQRFAVIETSEDEGDATSITNGTTDVEDMISQAADMG